MASDKKIKAYLPIIIGATVLLVIVVVIINLLSNIEDKPEKKERKVQTITLAKPPPPPPPPPKVEKPPEPVENKIEEAAEPEPEEMPETPNEPPPGDLGLDAEGSAGGDSFGLAARKGGKGLLGGGGGDPYAWYGGVVKNEILELLSDHEELRRKGYTAVVKFWVNVDGSVQRFELARGSNDKEIDDLLNHLLSKYKKVNEPLPPGMEQPLKLRISSKI